MKVEPASSIWSLQIGRMGCKAACHFQNDDRCVHLLQECTGSHVQGECQEPSSQQTRCVHAETSLVTAREPTGTHANIPALPRVLSEGLPACALLAVTSIIECPLIFSLISWSFHPFHQTLPVVSTNCCTDNILKHLHVQACMCRSPAAAIIAMDTVSMCRW